MIKATVDFNNNNTRTHSIKTNKMGSNGFIASLAIKALYYHHHSIKTLLEKGRRHGIIRE